jgi:hypothetical protein
MKLDHPNLGHTGGAALHTHIADIYTKISNNVDTRYQEYTSVSNSAVTTYEHNFNVPFSDMTVVLWSGVGTAKTRIENPTASGWTIAATAGFTKTKIDITAPSSGGPHDFSVEVHSGLRGLSTASTSNVTFSGSTITGLSTLLLTSSTVYDWLKFQEFGGSDYVQIAAPSLASSYTLTLPTSDGNADEVMITDGSGALSFGKVANANVANSAAIDYSKLNLSNSIVNNDVNSSAAIAYSKLNLTSSIVNGDVSNSAAIAYGKLNLSNSIVNADVSASAAIDATKLGTGSVSNTELGYVDGVTSSIQTQLDSKLSKSGGVMTGAITLAADAVNPLEPVTKQQFDSGLNGIAWKQPVRTATTAAGTLATSFENGDSVGGVTVATNDRILIKDQATSSENGIYFVNASGAPTRTNDADSYNELNGAAVIVSEGTNENKGYYQSTELTSFSGQVWFQNFGTGLYFADGNGIELSGQTFSLELDGTTLSKSASGLKVEQGNLTLDSIGGTLSVSKGGTGSGTASGARSNLSAAASGVNSDITSLSGLTTPLSVSQGGTGLASGTSGGVPYYSGSNTIASSLALTQNGVVLGGGTGGAPTATSAGSAYQPLRVPSGGGAPAFGALDLSQSAAVTGTLSASNGGTGITSLGSGVATFLGTPSSANLATALTDETGTGAAVFASSPSLTTPTLTTPRIDSALNLQQISTPSNPSSGFNKIYPKTDGLLYKLDSFGNEVLVGSGSGAGEINIVINPDADTALDGSRTNGVGDWVDSGTGTTSSRTTTAAEIPLSPTKTNGIKILNDGSSTGYTRLRMTLPTALQNRKLKIAWQQLYSTGTAYASGDFKLELYSNAAADYSGAYTAIALSTDASGVTSIPALNGQFQTSFDTSTAANLELRITRVAGTTNSYIALNAVTVGPGIQPQGAVVGQWNSYTPTGNGFDGSATFSGQWRRIGDTMHIRASGKFAGAATGTTTINFPTGYTVNESLLAPPTLGDRSVIGTVEFWDASATTIYTGTATYIIGTGGPRFYGPNGIALWTTGTPVTAASGDVVAMDVMIPIAEWAGSGTVQLAQNDVEFASNSSTSDADDTTSYAYGPAGSLIPTITAATGTTQRRKQVQFNSPIQTNDLLVLEIAENGGPFLPIQQTIGYQTLETQQQAGTTSYYGIAFDYLASGSNKADVYFSKGGRVTSGNGYGTAGASYPRNSTDKWRVRKVSGGAAVGFGIVVPGTSAGLVSASGVPGITNGSTGPAGYVGELISSNNQNVSYGGGSGSWFTVTSISLSAGDWDVTAALYVAVGTSVSRNEFLVSTNSSATSALNGYSQADFAPATATYNSMSTLPNVQFSSSSSQTIYLRTNITFTGTPSISYRLTARRIR